MLSEARSLQSLHLTGVCHQYEADNTNELCYHVLPVQAQKKLKIFHTGFLSVYAM